MFGGKALGWMGRDIGLDAGRTRQTYPPRDGGERGEGGGSTNVHTSPPPQPPGMGGAPWGGRVALVSETVRRNRPALTHQKHVPQSLRAHRLPPKTQPPGSTARALASAFVASPPPFSRAGFPCGIDGANLRW